MEIISYYLYLYKVNLECNFWNPQFFQKNKRKTSMFFMFLYFTQLWTTSINTLLRLLGGRTRFSADISHLVTEKRYMKKLSILRALRIIFSRVLFVFWKNWEFQFFFLENHWLLVDIFGFWNTKILSNLNDFLIFKLETLQPVCSNKVQCHMCA